MEDVTHKQIYDRLVAVENKVNTIDGNTKELVKAFEAVKGAFTVLGWVASAAKPILWIMGVGATIGIAWNNIRGKH